MHRFESRSSLDVGKVHRFAAVARNAATSGLTTPSHPHFAASQIDRDELIFGEIVSPINHPALPFALR